ncbi:MAG: hypothetical protein ACXVDJ_11495 [Tumebacillaceae bacterium]
MFDPTIYDNLKVVFEGALYDLDREGRVLVSGREDLIDLAAMSRTFRMQVEKLEGCCKAKVELSSGLVDFAGELRRMRLADEVPGCELRIGLWLPEAMTAHSEALHEYLEDVWGEVAEPRHERITRFQPGVTQPAVVGAHEGTYKIDLVFRNKIDEDNMDDVVPLLDHLVGTLEFLEHRGKTDKR